MLQNYGGKRGKEKGQGKKKMYSTQLPEKEIAKRQVKTRLHGQTRNS